MTGWLPPLRWIPSPNYNSRGGCKIDQIVIHDMEGHDKPSEELFEERSSRVSAHYTVSADGKNVDQMVLEKNRAWHACDGNSRSLGIEMEGFARNGYPQVELLTAARLAAHLAEKYGIPIQYAKGGTGAGILSHWSGGKAYGGHSDPEATDAWIETFVALVKTEHAAGNYPRDYAPGSDLDAPDPAKHDLSTTFGVQEALKSMLFDLQVDGQLGPETESVVGSFQTIAGVKPTKRGAIDDATRAAITKALEGS